MCCYKDDLKDLLETFAVTIGFTALSVAVVIYVFVWLFPPQDQPVPGDGSAMWVPTPTDVYQQKTNEDPPSGFPPETGTWQEPPADMQTVPTWAEPAPGQTN